MNLQSIWGVATAELRLDRRLARTWLFIVFAALFSVFLMASNLVNYSLFSSVSSSTLLNSPLMTPFQLYPTIIGFLSIAVIFLAFDVRARDKRERLDEIVGTLPLSNFELVCGRATGITVLMVIPIIVLIAIYYICGQIVEVALPDSSFRAPEIYLTLATLLIDTVPNILFWVALVMLITLIVRLRVIALAIVAGLFALQYWATSNLPLYILNIMNTLTAQAILPSDVAPIFTNVEILVNRLGLLLMGLAFLSWTALLYPRLDKTNTQKLLIAGLVLTFLGVLSFYATNYLFRSQYFDREEFASVHAQYSDQNLLNIKSLNGKIVINPGDDLELEVTMNLTARQQISSNEPLIFSLNPGFDVERVLLNRMPVQFSFANGLLSVELVESINPSQTIALSLKAAGEMNPLFTYLDSAVDLLSSEVFDAFGLLFQGTYGSINTSDYVALVPDLAWYPMPGGHLNRGLKHTRPRDFFAIELDIVIPDDWHVAGPGKSVIRATNDAKVVTFAPKSPVHEIALFAAEFERRTTDIEGIEFELLVSPGNVRNVDLFAPILDDLKSQVSEVLVRANKYGLGYPYDAFTIVETPINLRAYGGGWRMETAQSFPGIFAMREGSFLQADFGVPVENIKNDADMADEEKRELIMAFVVNYFKNDVSGGNIYLAATNNLMQYQFDASGSGAIPLSYLMNYLGGYLITDLEGFYSAHASLRVAAPQTAGIGAAQVIDSGGTQTLGNLFFDWNVDQPNVWDAMLSKPFGQTDYENAENAKTNLHVLHLWGRSTGHLIRDWLGDEKLGQLLSELRRRYVGQNYTYDDLMVVAAGFGIDLGEILGDSLEQIQLAGFRYSPVRTVRLPDLAYGFPQYESSFYIENGEPVPGLITVEYSSSTDVRTSQDRGAEVTEPIKIPKNGTVQVALTSENPLQLIRINPYLSHNRATFSLKMPDEREYQEVTRAALPMVQAAGWRYDDGNGIVVDDLDAGFSVDPTAVDAGTPWFSGILSFLLGETVLDQGLPSFSGGIAGINLTYGQWAREQTDEAYGKYRRTLARAAENSTQANVHFKASLPAAGRWQLEYYLPLAKTSSLTASFAVGTSGTGPNLRSNTDRPGETWGNFPMWLTTADRKIPIAFDGESMKEGWNRLGVFDLESPNVTLSLSSETNKGYVVADAIRWTQVQ